MLNLHIDNSTATDRNNVIDTTYFVQNGAWELVATPASRITSKFEAETYIEVR